MILIRFIISSWGARGTGVLFGPTTRSMCAVAALLLVMAAVNPVPVPPAWSLPAPLIAGTILGAVNASAVCRDVTDSRYAALRYYGFSAGGFMGLSSPGVQLGDVPLDIDSADRLGAESAPVIPGEKGGSAATRPTAEHLLGIAHLLQGPQTPDTRIVGQPFAALLLRPEMGERPGLRHAHRDHRHRALLPG